MALQVTGLRSPLGLIVVRDAIGVEGTDSLGRAGELMRAHDVSALLVDDGRAILSERDMARALAGGLGADDTVSAVATFQPLTVPAEMPIVDAAALMLNEEIRHLVVRFDQVRLGIVSLRTLLAVLLQAAKPEIWLEHLRIRINLAPPDLWIG